MGEQGETQIFFDCIRGFCDRCPQKGAKIFAAGSYDYIGGCVKPGAQYQMIIQGSTQVQDDYDYCKSQQRIKIFDYLFQALF